MVAEIPAVTSSVVASENLSLRDETEKLYKQSVCLVCFFLRVPPSSSERSSELLIVMISKPFGTVRVRVPLRSSEFL